MRLGKDAGSSVAARCRDKVLVRSDLGFAAGCGLARGVINAVTHGNESVRIDAKNHDALGTIAS